MKGADFVELSTDYLAANGTHCRLAMNPIVPSWTASALACIPGGGPVRTARVGAEVTGSTDVRSIKYSLGASFFQSKNGLSYLASLKT